MPISACPDPPYDLLAPTAPRRPLVVASPHSGTWVPDAFLDEARLDRFRLKTSEDCFVNEIFAAAPETGAPLLQALFSRAYLDVNREPFELDPLMFHDELPAYVNCTSPRVAVGLGTIPRVVADGEAIYRSKLRFADAEARIRQLHAPYHLALERLVADTAARFGFCTLLDAHSMPSGTAGGVPKRRVDIVLGDRMGSSCHPLVTHVAERTLRELGYSVALNAPYAGGFTTRNYGRPYEGRHALQIEINRALYMNERSLERKPFIATMRGHMAELMMRLGHVELESLAGIADAAQ